MKKTVLLTLLAGAACAATAQEQGRVLSSTPIVQQVAIPRQVCGTDTVYAGAPNSGAGAVMGAIAGGAIGNSIGGGSGRAAATAVGVLGGAVAGNAIEGRNNQEYVQGYRLSVQLDQGGYRVYDVSSPGDLRIGDRVRLYNGQISRM